MLCVHKYLTDLDRAFLGDISWRIQLPFKKGYESILTGGQESRVIPFHGTFSFRATSACTYTRTIEQLMNQQNSKSSDQHYYIEYYNMMYTK